MSFDDDYFTFWIMVQKVSYFRGQACRFMLIFLYNSTLFGGENFEDRFYRCR